MKLQPGLCFSSASLLQLVTRSLSAALSAASVRCCAALLLFAVVTQAGQARTLNTVAIFTGGAVGDPLFRPPFLGPHRNLYRTNSGGGAHARGTPFRATPRRTA